MDGQKKKSGKSLFYRTLGAAAQENGATGWKEQEKRRNERRKQKINKEEEKDLEIFSTI